MKSAPNAHCFPLCEIRQKQTNIEFLIQNVQNTNPHYEIMDSRSSSTLIIKAQVLPWEFGAQVSYLDSSGRPVTENLLYPPIVGRFAPDDYNEIVQLINKATSRMKMTKPPS